MDRDELFDLCVYLATSAERLKEEPKDYGPLRLLEVLSRLANHAATTCGDTFLRDVASDVSEKQDLVMSDQTAFYRFIEQLVITFAKEAKKRYAAREETIDTRLG